MPVVELGQVLVHWEAGLASVEGDAPLDDVITEDTSVLAGDLFDGNTHGRPPMRVPAYRLVAAVIIVVDDWILALRAPVAGDSPAVLQVSED